MKQIETIAKQRRRERATKSEPKQLLRFRVILVQGPKVAGPFNRAPPPPPQDHPKGSLDAKRQKSSQIDVFDSLGKLI